MKNIDYIIIGGGFAGMFLAWELYFQDKSFLIYSGTKDNASAKAAGIVNPVILKKFTTFPMVVDQLENLKKICKKIENEIGCQILYPYSVSRIFHDQEEKKTWIKKSIQPDLEHYLSNDFLKNSVVNNPFGCGIVNDSYWLDIAAFFKESNVFFSKTKHIILEDFDYKMLDKDQSKYQDCTFRRIVFCEGRHVIDNPFFSNNLIIPNKGHYIKVKLLKPINEKVVFKKKHFLIPIYEDVYYYGATYAKDVLEECIDPTSITELLEGLEEIYPHPYTIIDQGYGFRATVRNRKPILGQHPLHNNFYIFNGLGTRGILNSTFYANILIDYIENGNPLPKDINITRFYK